MGVELWELWIIDKSGLYLVHIRNPNFSDKMTVSPVLFSGILSAIETMAAKTIEAINMSDSKILILPQQSPISIFFVGRVAIKKKDKNVLKLLEKIKTLFLAEYAQILPTWSGDQAIFDYFIEICREKFF